MLFVDKGGSDTYIPVIFSNAEALRMINIRFNIPLVVTLLIVGCGKQSSPSSQRPIVVAVEGDIDSFNPLFAEE
jgi:hypothetical protein